MNSTRFMVCEHCGNLVGMIIDKGVPCKCCGENMHELIPGAVEAATEKHIPVVEVSENEVTVCVGSLAHPMMAEHSIEWIYLQTERGGQRKGLNPGEEPKLTFALAGDKAVAAYAYCNLHGLWKADIK